LKKSIFAVAILMALTALTIWGNRLLGHTLDARLAPMLSEQLGLPVQLAPISAHALQLTAHTSKLVMGTQLDPAVVATDVKVRLSWSALLHGEIRLVTASASELMLRPSRWPSRNTALPENYQPAGELPISRSVDAPEPATTKRTLRQ